MGQLKYDRSIHGGFHRLADLTTPECRSPSPIIALQQDCWAWFRGNPRQFWLMQFRADIMHK
jgi:hypothetical protein